MKENHECLECNELFWSSEVEDLCPRCVHELEYMDGLWPTPEETLQAIMRDKLESAEYDKLMEQVKDMFPSNLTEEEFERMVEDYERQWEQEKQLELYYPTLAAGDHNV